jgi:hypothetical protein
MGVVASSWVPRRGQSDSHSDSSRELEMGRWVAWFRWLARISSSGGPAQQMVSCHSSLRLSLGDPPPFRNLILRACASER